MQAPSEQIELDPCAQSRSGARSKGKREGEKEMARQGSHPRPASSGQDGKELAQAIDLDLPVVASAPHEDDRLEQEILRLVQSSRDGRLSERGRTEHLEGASRKVIEAVNEMLDAILLPIGEGNRILTLIRGGDLRERVEIACKGDHERMKDSVNGVHGWLIDLVAFVTKIAHGDMTASMK
jgi:hypothetical protein